MVQNQSRNIIGFIHCYTVNNWMEILYEQTDKIIISGLYEKVDKIYVGLVGPPIELSPELPKKFNFMFHMENPEIGESLTLAMLHQKSKTFDGCIFYIHSKGASRNSPQHQVDWRNYMEYFLIDQPKIVLKELEKVDCVGVNWHILEGTSKSKMYGKLVFQPTTTCFAGNFWWANSEYIRNLPNLFPIKGRFDSEFWIGLNTPKVAELWCSKVLHHRNQYPRDNYIGKINIKYFKGAHPQ